MNTPHAPAAAGTRILRLDEVCAKIGLRKTAVYQMAADGEMPSQVRIGARAVGWVEREIDAWLAQRIERGRVHRSQAPADGGGDAGR
ncbi:MAG: AlpA family transcriptional regulator [Burkholderiaceae bacterium]|jgi:prophage regulatory protein|nr:AlpA family transcriptional regulator [Burkholderiaceae bacterium]MEB2352014.1 AlpA family transcriptional regulator [Burkholderiaceae bacterium]